MSNENSKSVFKTSELTLINMELMDEKKGLVSMTFSDGSVNIDFAGFPERIAKNSYLIGRKYFIEMSKADSDNGLTFKVERISIDLFSGNNRRVDIKAVHREKSFWIEIDFVVGEKDLDCQYGDILSVRIIDAE